MKMKQLFSFVSSMHTRCTGSKMADLVTTGVRNGAWAVGLSVGWGEWRKDNVSRQGKVNINRNRSARHWSNQCIPFHRWLDFISVLNCSMKIKLKRCYETRERVAIYDTWIQNSSDHRPPQIQTIEDFVNTSYGIGSTILWLLFEYDIPVLSNFIRLFFLKWPGGLEATLYTILKIVYSLIFNWKWI